MENNLFENSDIIEVNIEESIKKSYLDYSMSVIIGRALPDARDGLKPVHRRILYAMNELNLTSRAPYKKSARIVGDVIGKYHPHGDTSVYDALVRMAQPFSMRVPLVDGQGNFGSVDGDGAAAMRYTEARMTKYAEDNLKDIAWLPPSCAYRRIFEGQGLEDWHHLISGDKNTIHQTGNSALGKVVFEKDVKDDELEEHIVEWPLSN